MQWLKAVAPWLAVAALYLLLYQGMVNGLWPMITDFRHADWNLPGLVDTITGVISQSIPRRLPDCGNIA
jgi:hypothetical protein